MKTPGNKRVEEEGGRDRKRLKPPASIRYSTSQSNIFEGFYSNDLKNKGDICKFKKMKSVFNY